MSRSGLKLWRDERGVSAVEYGLIISLVVMAMMVGLTQLADVTTSLWNYLSQQVLGSSSAS